MLHHHHHSYKQLINQCLKKVSTRSTNNNNSSLLLISPASQVNISHYHSNHLLCRSSKNNNNNNGKNGVNRKNKNSNNNNENHTTTSPATNTSTSTTTTTSTSPPKSNHHHHHNNNTIPPPPPPPSSSSSHSNNKNHSLNLKLKQQQRQQSKFLINLVDSDSQQQYQEYMNNMLRVIDQLILEEEDYGQAFEMINELINSDSENSLLYLKRAHVYMCEYMIPFYTLIQERVQQQQQQVTINNNNNNNNTSSSDVNVSSSSSSSSGGGGVKRCPISDHFRYQQMKLMKIVEKMEQDLSSYQQYSPLNHNTCATTTTTTTTTTNHMMNDDQQLDDDMDDIMLVDGEAEEEEEDIDMMGEEFMVDSNVDDARVVMMTSATTNIMNHDPSSSSKKIAHIEYHLLSSFVSMMKYCLSVSPFTTTTATTINATNAAATMTCAQSSLSVLLNESIQSINECLSAQPYHYLHYMQKAILHLVLSTASTTTSTTSAASSSSSSTASNKKHLNMDEEKLNIALKCMEQSIFLEPRSKSRTLNWIRYKFLVDIHAHVTQDFEAAHKWCDKAINKSVQVGSFYVYKAKLYYQQQHHHDPLYEHEHHHHNRNKNKDHHVLDSGKKKQHSATHHHHGHSYHSLYDSYMKESLKYGQLEDSTLQSYQTLWLCERLKNKDQLLDALKQIDSALYMSPHIGMLYCIRAELYQLLNMENEALKDVEMSHSLVMLDPYWRIRRCMITIECCAKLNRLHVAEQSIERNASSEHEKLILREQLFYQFHTTDIEAANEYVKSNEIPMAVRVWEGIMSDSRFDSSVLAHMLYAMVLIREIPSSSTATTMETNMSEQNEERYQLAVRHAKKSLNLLLSGGVTSISQIPKEYALYKCMHLNLVHLRKLVKQ